MLSCFPPFSIETFSFQPLQTTFIPTHNRHRGKKNTSAPFICRLGVGFEDVAAITNNKVLLAATLSAAVGQLSKPFTSSLIYGNDFDLKSAFQSGGFPSTHSSAVVATATCLGLERGFSDAIFGVAVVYAALIMYDAQGVRREVGKHARTINSVILENRVGVESATTPTTLHTFPGGGSNVSTSPSRSADDLQKGKPSLLNAVESTSSGSGSQVEERTSDITVENKVSYSSLYERVGHTEVEVVAGAILGALVSLTLYAVA